MSKARYFIPIISVSIISASAVYPVYVYTIRRLAYSQITFFGIILLLIPIIIAILLSLISGYIIDPSDNQDKYPFGAFFLVATLTFFSSAHIFFLSLHW